MIRENHVYDELKIGDCAELKRLCTADDLFVFAHASGNINPMHLPDRDGDGDGKPEAIAPSMWVGSLISAVLGNILPGPGTLYNTQNLRFLGRAHAGDELVARVTVVAKEPDRVVRLATRIERADDGAALVDGEATVTAPERKLRFDDLHVPGLVVQRHAHFDQLLARAGPLDPTVTAVVAPEEINSLGGALLAAEAAIITPAEDRGSSCGFAQGYFTLRAD
jgi:phosphate butyryltransferase